MDNTFVFIEQPASATYLANTPYLVIGDGTAAAVITDAANVTVSVSPVSVNRKGVTDPFTYDGDAPSRITVSDKSTPMNKWRFCGTTEAARETTVGDGNWVVNAPAAGHTDNLVSIWGSSQTKVLNAGNTWLAATSGVTAGRAFISQLEGVAGAKINFAFQGIDGSTTGINGITDDSGNNVETRIYNITGQYVGKDINALPKGIYIVNGKKIIK